MLKANKVAWALGLFSIFVAFTGWVWHGLLGQPSMMTQLYPWFSWSNPLHLVGMAVLFFIWGLIYGVAFTWIYNWAEKKFK